MAPAEHSLEVASRQYYQNLGQRALRWDRGAEHAAHRREVRPEQISPGSELCAGGSAGLAFYRVKILEGAAPVDIPTCPTVRPSQRFWRGAPVGALRRYAARLQPSIDGHWCAG